MLIVNQKRDIVINFSNVLSIYVQENNVQTLISCVEDALILGKYKTKERAKEVLQEIVEVFTDEEFFHIRKSSLNNLDELAEPKYILKPISRPKVYEMPEE